MVVWLAFASVFMLLGLHGLVTGQVRAKGCRRYTRAETPNMYAFIVGGYFAVVALMVVLAVVLF